MSSQTIKKISSSSFLFLTLLLSACGEIESLDISDETTESITTVEENSTTEITESKINEDSFDTESTSETSYIENVERNFQILAINDLHGACEASPYYSNYSIGLAKMSTFFKSESENITTFILSAGDMWQGSIESNSNYGNYVTEAMNIMNFDCMTIGNHDFDWGLDKLYANLEIADFPFLGGNIVYKDDLRLIDNVRTSVLIEKDGIKLGVIGIIGEEQYRSITHSFVADLNFIPYDELVINEASALKKEGADFIVLMPHEDWDEDTVATSLNSSDSVAVEKKKVLDSGYIDLVIHSHNHSYSNWTYNGIPLLRGVCNGVAYDKVIVEKRDDISTIKFADVNYFSENQYKTIEEDTEIIELYKSKYDVEVYKNTVIGKCDGYISADNLSNFAAEAMYDKIGNDPYYENIDFLGAFTNKARKAIYQGDVTIGMLWESFPFDDQLFIMTLKGSTLKYCSTIDGGYLKFVSQKGLYPRNCTSNINDNSTYNIITIDYLGEKVGPEYLVQETIFTGQYLRNAIQDYLIKIGTINVSKYS